MLITDRQADILNNIIKEYINSAQPVSSKLLEKKYDFDVSPATIRIEMQRLADEGLIFQPHTSSGRVPTDKGYRFFVDCILNKGSFASEAEGLIEGDMQNTVRLLGEITRKLAGVSSDLVLGYLPGEKLLWKDGWEKVLQEPEFQEREFASDFAKAIKNLEKGFEDMDFESEINVFIGRENPFPRAKEFSTIVAKCRFPENEEGYLAIFGPKRMSYDRNIGELASLIKLLEKM